MSGVRQKPFYVVPGPAVQDVLARATEEVAEIVRRAYSLHAAGQTVNPDSYFLLFPQNPTARIVALPAYIGGEFDRAGVKWISSFPENRLKGLSRASGVLILNDYETGFPLACLEVSVINAARTAASAVIAAELLTPWAGCKVKTLGVVGAGVIARATATCLWELGWRFERVRVVDLDPDRAQDFAKSVGEVIDAEASTASLEEVISGAELIILATTARSPHITERRWFDHCPTLLHLSLRDMAVPLVLEAQNVVDDVNHCLKASTSLHLAEQGVKNRQFVSGTLADVMAGAVTPDRQKTRLFSPFGLGILDLAVGCFVLERCLQLGLAIEVSGFFPPFEN